MAKASKTKKAKTGSKVSKKKPAKKKATKAAPATTPAKIVYLSFCAEITTHTVEQLIAFCANKANEGFDEIHIGLSTPGGGTRDGVAAFHVLKGLPIKLVMYNVGSVDSIGVAIFLAGEERYACKGTTFLFHGVGFDVGGSTSIRLDEPTIKDKLELIVTDNKKIADIISSRTSINAKEAADLFRKQATKDTVYARKNILIHAVREFAVPKGFQIFQLVFKR